ncbi:MAG: hypothetical protein AAF721_34510 [Myxococcota bacterium]
MPPALRVRALLWAAAATIALPTTASAAPCPTDAAVGGEVAASVAERTEFLEAKVARGAHLSRAWALGWGVSLGILAIGQVGIAPLTPKEERIEWWVGAGASTVGVLTRAVFRPRVLKEKRLLAKSDATGCERVGELERAVARSARWEHQGRGLLMHALSLGFNAGVGVLLGVAFKRPLGGNRLVMIGGVVGEVMILTQPQYMSRSVDEYRSGRASARWTSRPLVLRGGGGLTLSGGF